MRFVGSHRMEALVALTLMDSLLIMMSLLVRLSPDL